MNGETRQKVLDLLVREADMDGVVTLSESEAARILGITQPTVGYHYRMLLAEGAISRADDVGLTGRSTSGITPFQLAESVMSA